jgi:hypothetical protein
MSTVENLTQTLDDMEAVTKLFEITPFDIYFLGGAACVLGGYTDRATRDFDFLDMQYESRMGRVFSILRDYDMLEYESTILAPDYKDRAIKMEKYTAFNAWLLSPEDIVVSKIIRLAQKDIQDIDTFIAICDKDLIVRIIDKVSARSDLFESKKQAFINNLKSFREKYNV